MQCHQTPARSPRCDGARIEPNGGVCRLAGPTPPQCRQQTEPCPRLVVRRSLTPTQATPAWWLLCWASGDVFDSERQSPSWPSQSCGTRRWRPVLPRLCGHEPRGGRRANAIARTALAERSWVGDREHERSAPATTFGSRARRIRGNARAPRACRARTRPAERIHPPDHFWSTVDQDHPSARSTAPLLRVTHGYSETTAVRRHNSCLSMSTPLSPPLDPQ